MGRRKRDIKIIFDAVTSQATIEQPYTEPWYAIKLEVTNWAFESAATPKFLQLYFPDIPNISSNTNADQHMVQLPLGPGQITAQNGWTGLPIVALREDDGRRLRIPPRLTVALYNDASPPVLMSSLGGWNGGYVFLRVKIEE